MWRDLWWTETADKCFNGTTGTFKHDPFTGKMIPRDIEAGVESNWLFFGNSSRHMDCGLWHSVMFNNYGLVPSYCRFRCWKVVIAIPTVECLMRFYNFARTIPHIIETCTPFSGKCGIDTRWYSDKAYDAFFYCDGFEDGIERYRVLAKLIREHFIFMPELADACILKKACTEFEKAYGPTDGEFWQRMTEEEIDLQRHLEDIYGQTRYDVNHPEWFINRTFRRWIKFANTHGDKSWLNYYPGEDFLTMKAVTYHHLALVEKPKGKRARDEKGKFTKQKE